MKPAFWWVSQFARVREPVTVIVRPLATVVGEAFDDSVEYRCTAGAARPVRSAAPIVLRSCAAAGF